MRNPFLERLIEKRMNGIDQGPWPHWKNVESGPNNEKRIEFYRNQPGATFNRALYADDEPTPFSHPAGWQRFMNWLGDNRVTNAWLVLIGREDIDREYR